MDFNWIRCISETLRKISFKASGSYAKITYIVLIHMYVSGTNGDFSSFLHDNVRFEPWPAARRSWRGIKVKKIKDWRATTALWRHVVGEYEIKEIQAMEIYFM